MPMAWSLMFSCRAHGPASSLNHDLHHANCIVHLLAPHWYSIERGASTITTVGTHVRQQYYRMRRVALPTAASTSHMRMCEPCRLTGDELLRRRAQVPATSKRCCAEATDHAMPPADARRRSDIHHLLTAARELRGPDHQQTQQRPPMTQESTIR